MKNTFVFTLMLMLLGLLYAPTATATVFDITTRADATEQGRVARYVGSVVNFGHTVGHIVDGNTGEVTFSSQGLYDYASFRGIANDWSAICDGNLSINGRCDTFDAGGDDFFGEDFVGYMFKQPATVQTINFVNNALRDGGTFAAEPRVELLVGGTLKSGGTWQTVSATWDTPYNITYGLDGTGYENRAYSITVDASVGAVWGARIIEYALDSWETSGGAIKSSGDTSGFLSISEVQVIADVAVADQIDLSNNLAAGQTAIWAATIGQGNTAYVTDGVYGAYVNTVYFDSTTLPDGEEYLGVMFDTAKSNVAAIGASQKMYDVGGYLVPNTIRVEYTTDGGTSWIAATGLDLGRYAEDYEDLKLITRWSQYDTELFTFDAISATIDGIRMIGTPDATGWIGDPSGFMATNEMEVFAAVVPEPGTLFLLMTLGVCALGLWRRR